MRETPILLTPGEAVGRLLPLLDAGASVPLRVTGNSMVPFLRDRRDLVSLRAPRFLPYQPGDILLFRRAGGQLVLHRLRKVRGDGTLLLNGDGQTWLETASQEQVLAVVEHIRRDDGPPFSPRRMDQRLLQRLWGALIPFRRPLLRLLGRLSRLRS